MKCDANGDAGAAEAVAATVSMSHVDSVSVHNLHALSVLFLAYSVLSLGINHYRYTIKG